MNKDHISTSTTDWETIKGLVLQVGTDKAKLVHKVEAESDQHHHDVQKRKMDLAEQCNNLVDHVDHCIHVTDSWEDPTTSLKLVSKWLEEIQEATANMDIDDQECIDNLVKKREALEKKKQISK